MRLNTNVTWIGFFLPQQKWKRKRRNSQQPAGEQNQVQLQVSEGKGEEGGEEREGNVLRDRQL